MKVVVSIVEGDGKSPLCQCCCAGYLRGFRQTLTSASRNRFA